MQKKISNRPRFLLYGLNLEILRETASVLQGAGACETDFAITEYEFDRCLGRTRLPYDLLVLCHTIHVREQQRIQESESRYSNLPIYPIQVSDAPNQLPAMVAGWLCNSHVRAHASGQLLDWARISDHGSTDERMEGSKAGFLGLAVFKLTRSRG
jgi:hypothetical protein